MKPPQGGREHGCGAVPSSSFRGRIFPRLGQTFQREVTCCCSAFAELKYAVRHLAGALGIPRPDPLQPSFPAYRPASGRTCPRAASLWRAAGNGRRLVTIRRTMQLQ